MPSGTDAIQAANTAIAGSRYNGSGRAGACVK
jgi:hypothetical protein